MHLFVYGSLTNPRRLDEVIGHVHTGERLRARLRGYERQQRDAEPYPFVVPADGAWTDGVLILDLAEADVRAIDAYEEVDQRRYRRLPVDVEVWGCGPGASQMRAETYVAGAGR
jgi:gamma-glutamylcyclotransferase (GGCT)/AIG2-like uncharacterized protein YtfP